MGEFCRCDNHAGTGRGCAIAALLIAPAQPSVRSKVLDSDVVAAFVVELPPRSAVRATTLL